MSSSASSSATSPEATPEATGFHYSYYLSAFPPTWDTLQKGLAFFAVLVILRSCLIRLRVWASSLKDRAAAAAPVPKAPPPPPSTTTTTSSTTSTKDRRRQNKDNNGFQDKLPQPSLQHNHGPSPTYTTTINHFRPYINQRYPSSIPPWLKEPPKFGMDEGRGLVNPLETGDGSLVPAGLLDGDDGDAPPDVLKTPPPPPPGDQHWNRVGTGPLRHLLARPPPAPPLTPPELSNSIFTLGGRAHNHESFIHQPNPDYASASSSTPSSSSPQARRYSYTKTIPIGVPIHRQQQQPSSSSAAAAAAAAAAGDDIVQGADLTFSPSSFPPTSPLLPPAPPVVPRSLGGADEPEPAAVASAAAAERSGRREIDLKGQVVSVLDQDGAGWKRHTRVYGGGVCLACKAAGQEHGAGGFYGATVSPEEMR